jgi:hypothetical protein
VERFERRGRSSRAQQLAVAAHSFLTYEENDQHDRGNDKKYRQKCHEKAAASRARSKEETNAMWPSGPKE